MANISGTLDNDTVNTSSHSFGVSGNTTASQDHVSMLGGDDYVDAGGGNDDIFGGDGDDYIAGGYGDDSDGSRP